MSERMSEHAKGDIEAVLDRLYKVSPDLDKLAATETVQGPKGAWVKSIIRAI
ncbi:hypothetical protein HFO86_14995 [Rhizobium leguminosarum]|uniref:hypothetical protein n=1 Tax=Rhizobium leguminosarum TaxID=384 RepID=UPI001C967820|nr:hypothetical protein [Rhizobium leguminosarum]MBY5471507.1 hypothetical protein [Rhizobium leguminosarum]